jgi:uncharacterized protein YndB with AHSA1/START domain
MLTARHSVTIRRPQQQVFDYLADGTHDPDWRQGVLEIRRTSATDGLGATYRQVLRGPGGRRIDGDYRITQFDPPRRLDFEVVAGPLRPTGSFELAARDAATTEVTFTLDANPTGGMRLMTPMISRQMRAEVGALDTLKRVLEQG